MRGHFALILLGAVALKSVADPFCFAMAENYYEQLYCQVSARLSGHKLPPFHEFQRSTLDTQYLLIKRPARKLGVLAPAPVIKKQGDLLQGKNSSLPGFVAKSKTESVKQTAQHVPQAEESCILLTNSFQCHAGRFSVVGNRANNKLKSGVLEPGNVMALPRKNSTITLADYLAQAYGHYLERMHLIGLAGSTMTYGKFMKLYQSMAEIGVDFNDRMEELYGFLKQDKRNLAVKESVTVPSSLAFSSCEFANNQFITCPVGHGNLVFKR